MDKKKILLIEDEEGLIEIYKVAFANGGYKTIAVRDFRKSIKQVKKNQPDLIILDLVFANDAGKLSKEPGFNTLEKLKKDPATKNIPVIVFTNLSGDEEKQAFKLGAADFATKANTNPKTMLEKVEKVLK